MVRQVLAVDEEAPAPVHRLAYACAEDPAHAPPPTLREETLLEEDRAATDRRRASLKLGPFARDGLGLAFSGGGVRAASFQSGVLWRMAELSLLPKKHQRFVLRLLPRVLREGALRPLPLFGRGQPVPDAPAVREPCEIRPRPRRGAPRGARRGARRGDAAEVEPRGGAHQPEARGGVILPVLRSTFLFLADTPSPRPRHRRDTND